MRFFVNLFCITREDIKKSQRDIRWWLFKQLSSLGWWICPEPDKTVLKIVWDDAIEHACKELKKP